VVSHTEAATAEAGNVSDRRERRSLRHYQGVPIRVVLAEDSVLLRDGIVRLLDGVDDVDVVASCGDRDTLLRLVDEHRPDVVVTDIRMPPEHDDEGIQVARRLRDERPDVGVVVLSQHASPRYALSLLDEGSAGRAYVLKERIGDVDELVQTIRTVAEGGSVIDPEVVDLLVQSKRGPTSSLEWLTPREREVLHAMAAGMSNAAIARALGLSVRAIEKHSNAVFVKLGISEEVDANRRVRAVLVYLGASTT
jgi:DNA-binding NarL/FixJ family response regulator